MSTQEKIAQLAKYIQDGLMLSDVTLSYDSDFRKEVQLWADSYMKNGSILIKNAEPDPMKDKLSIRAFGLQINFI